MRTVVSPHEHSGGRMILLSLMRCLKVKVKVREIDDLQDEALF